MKHKRARRQTRKQKELIQAAGYSPEDWLVQDVDNLSMTIVNRVTGGKKVIIC